MTKLNIDSTIVQPSELQFSGVLENLNTDLIWHGKLMMKNFDYITYFDNFGFDTAIPGLLSGKGQLNGDLKSVYVNGQFNTSLPNIGNIHSQLDLQFTNKTLHIKQASITKPDSPTKINIQGSLSLANNSWVFNRQSQWQDLQ